MESWGEKKRKMKDTDEWEEEEIQSNSTWPGENSRSKGYHRWGVW